MESMDRCTSTKQTIKGTDRASSRSYWLKSKCRGTKERIEYIVPEHFMGTLSEIIDAVCDFSDSEVDELMYDRHSGPVLSMAIRVGSKRLRKQLISKILKWDDVDLSKKRFFDYAGDSVASHFLEAVCIYFFSNRHSTKLHCIDF